MDGAAGTATLSNLRSKRTASERFLEGQQAVAEMEPTEWRVHRLDLGEGRFLHVEIHVEVQVGGLNAFVSQPDAWASAPVTVAG